MATLQECQRTYDNLSPPEYPEPTDYEWSCDHCGENNSIDTVACRECKRMDSEQLREFGDALIDRALELDATALQSFANAGADDRAATFLVDVIQAMHLAAPAACFTAEERLDALLHRLRKALKPAAELAIREGL